MCALITTLIVLLILKKSFTPPKNRSVSLPKKVFQKKLVKIKKILIKKVISFHKMKCQIKSFARTPSPQKNSSRKVSPPQKKVSPTQKINKNICLNIFRNSSTQPNILSGNPLVYNNHIYISLTLTHPIDPCYLHYAWEGGPCYFHYAGQFP